MGFANKVFWLFLFFFFYIFMLINMWLLLS